MKKAQIASQIFVYIFALFVISLILWFGVKAIYSFTKQAEEIELVRIETDLKARISSVAAEYDTREKVEVRLSKKFKDICFAGDNPSVIESEHPLIHNAIKTYNICV